jgi:hypothetical protein
MVKTASPTKQADLGDGLATAASAVFVAATGTQAAALPATHFRVVGTCWIQTAADTRLPCHTLKLQFTPGSTRSAQQVQTDSFGRFAFIALRAESYAISPASSAYRLSETSSKAFDEDHAAVTVTLIEKTMH